MSCNVTAVVKGPGGWSPAGVGAVLQGALGRRFHVGDLGVHPGSNEEL